MIKSNLKYQNHTPLLILHLYNNNQIKPAKKKPKKQELHLIIVNIHRNKITVYNTHLSRYLISQIYL